jgi:hypothetical protein
MIRAEATPDKFGPEQKRPKDDFRSAQEIVDSNDTLKNLGNQSGVKDALKKQVGDFEHDADAAYRATQVLEHVETFNENGERVTHAVSGRNDPGNGRIDGFTKDNEARHGTEAGRLQDFGKYGYSSLKGDLETVVAKPTPSAGHPAAESSLLPLEGEQRPSDDHRSAEQIIDDNPLLKNLGNQSGVKDNLKKQVGDYEHDADAAWRAVEVMTYVENFDEGGKQIHGGSIGNGTIDGFTRDGEARHGTEAGRLQDFGKYGYESLKGIDGKSADEKIEHLNSDATAAAVKEAGGDSKKVGADYYVSGKTDAGGADKVAALIDMSTALAQYKAGAEAFKFEGPGDPKSYTGEGLSPAQQRDAFVKDVQGKIDKLGGDADVQKFLNEKGPPALQKIVAADPNLKSEMERRLSISTGTEALQKDFARTGDDGKPVGTSEALSDFIKEPEFYAQALGVKADYHAALQNAPQEIKDKVTAGYDDITSGAEIKRLTDGGTAPDKAIIQSAVNKAAYDAVLDDDTVKAGSEKFDEATAALSRSELVDGKTLDDLYRGLGVTGADDPALATLIENNIASFTAPGADPPRVADIISAIRAFGDTMRAGAKFDDSASKFEDLMGATKKQWGDKLPSGVTDTYKAGVMHGVSAVLLAGAIGTRYATGSGGPAAQTVGQSFQVAGLLAEGGAKFVKDQYARAGQGGYKFDVPKFVGDIENVGKFLGGVTGNVLGLVTGALSAKDAAARGDTVGAGFQGAFAGLNGVSAIAGSLEVAAYIVPRVFTVASGVAESAALIGATAGAIAGAVGGAAAVGGLIYAIIASVKADEKRDQARDKWYEETSKAFADLGVDILPLSTITASNNASPDPFGDLAPTS